MIIYGGWNGKTTLCDMFLLNVIDYVWWEVILSNCIPRAYGRMFFKEESLYYIGGRTDTEVRSEVIKFDLSGLLSGEGDRYIFELESFTISQKQAEQNKTLLDDYQFIKLLGCSPLKISYLTADVGVPEYVANEKRSRMSLIEPIKFFISEEGLKCF